MKKMKFKPTPRIRTKTITVRGLLGKIKEVVLEEPARANLMGFCFSLNGDGLENLSGIQRTTPACGTVGCLAGWGAILLRPARAKVGNIGWAARHLARLIGYQTGSSPSEYARSVGSLFAGTAVPYYGESVATFGNPGTLKHAKVVARRIDLYLENHPEVADRVIDVAEARRLFS